jgi:hypothetical protein
VLAGGKDLDGADYHDVLKSMIDHDLGRKAKPDEEFDGKQKGANSKCLLGSGSSR